jgi:hypothetical protein
MKPGERGLGNQHNVFILERFSGSEDFCQMSPLMRACSTLKPAAWTLGAQVLPRRLAVWVPNPDENPWVGYPDFAGYPGTHGSNPHIVEVFLKTKTYN